MTVAPDGTIYWVERYSPTNSWKGRLRKLAPDGIVTTVAGGGDKVAENGNPAAEVALGSDPKGVAIGRDGSIYLALGYEKKVVRIAPERRHHPLRGQGRRQRARQDRRPAARRAQSYIDSPYSDRRVHATARSTSARSATTSARPAA